MSNFNGVLKFNQLGFEKKNPHRLLNGGLGGVFEAEPLIVKAWVPSIKLQNKLLNEEETKMHTCCFQSIGRRCITFLKHRNMKNEAYGISLFGFFVRILCFGL